MHKEKTRLGYNKMKYRYINIYMGHFQLMCVLCDINYTIRTAINQVVFALRSLKQESRGLIAPRILN